MIVGFTGSRKGMNLKQLESVRSFLLNIATGDQNEFHHGDSIGGDFESFTIAKELGWKTVAHPPNLGNWRAYTKSDIILPIFTPIIRNHNIVDASDIMIAAPDTNFEILRSGTWSTIRYARLKGKIIEKHIFYPRDGN